MKVITGKGDIENVVLVFVNKSDNIIEITIKKPGQKEGKKLKVTGDIVIVPE